MGIGTTIATIAIPAILSALFGGGGKEAGFEIPPMTPGQSSIDTALAELMGSTGGKIPMRGVNFGGNKFNTVQPGFKNQFQMLAGANRPASAQYLPAEPGWIDNLMPWLAYWGTKQ